MLELKSVTLADKPLFYEKLRAYEPVASDMCFTAVYMWGESLNLKYVEIEGLLCCMAFTSTIPPYCLPPVGNIMESDYERVIATLKEYFEREGLKLMFRRFDERDLDRIKQIKNVQLSCEYSRGSSDYVYLREDLVDLKGKKYDGKRNHISKFMRSYGERYEYLPMTEAHIPELTKLNDLYSVCKGGKCRHCTVCEREANMRVINNLDYLDCKGAVIRVDGKIEAFTIGQMLNQDTAIVHIEKANRDINGLYPMINRQFCMQGLTGATYVNREEDMDIEGLRKAKRSYHPVRLEKKYNITVL